MTTLTVNEKINVRSYIHTFGLLIKETAGQTIPDFAKKDRPYIESNMFYILINKQASKACLRKFEKRGF